MNRIEGENGLHKFTCTCISVLGVPYNHIIAFIQRISLGKRISNILAIQKLVHPHRSLRKLKDQYQQAPQKLTNFTDLTQENVLPGFFLHVQAVIRSGGWSKEAQQTHVIIVIKMDTTRLIVICSRNVLVDAD